MPRKPREEVEGATYHVFARGNNKQPIYLDDTDRITYLAMLGRTVGDKRWRCLAYCLMDNHLHLVIELVKTNLAAGMQTLQGLYAQTFNTRHGRGGHVFQGRYGAIRITDAQHMCTLAGYIACNPATAGLVALPEQWRWSSYAALVNRQAPGWLDREALLGHFDAFGGDPLQRYREAVGGYYSYGTKSALRAPQTGQYQSSGMSVNSVPGGIPPSGSPSAGS
jgi:putative transposase